MQLIHQDNPGTGGQFNALEKDQLAGTITYLWHDEDLLEINHTEVDEAYEGKGIGKKLADAVVDLAREKNARIKATCRFAKSVLMRNEAAKDILTD